MMKLKSINTPLFNKSTGNVHRGNFRKDKVYLRRAGRKYELRLRLKYTKNSLRVNREVKLYGNICEKISDGLHKVTTFIKNELFEHIRSRHKRINVNKIRVEFSRSGQKLNFGNATFSQILGHFELAAKMFSDVQLCVGHRYYKFLVNQPWVNKILLPYVIMAGFPIFPCKTSVQNSQRKHCKCVWYKAVKPKSGNLRDDAQWEHCGNGYYCITTEEDKGYYFKLKMIPRNAYGLSGPYMEIITQNPAQHGPGICPFESRHLFTQERLKGDSLRIVSYNTLANMYADTDYARTNLYPYCQPHALKMGYRRQLLIKELIGYNADIMCLQEIDVRIFKSEFEPLFLSTELGYRSLYTRKQMSGEGPVIFFKIDRFELIDTHALNIAAEIATSPLFADLWQKICDNTSIVKRICRCSTAAQVLHLKCRENGRHLLVVNTHLYFRPDAEHIRLLQFGFIMAYVESIFRAAEEKFKLIEPNSLSIIFCGDFNSVPDCGIYKLMTERFVMENCGDWNGIGAQAIGNVSLAQPFHMKSACGTPRFTNYTHQFGGCLDYIFFQSDRMEVQQIVPLPTDDELKEYFAIPSVVFPSDHVALIADLKFKND